MEYAFSIMMFALAAGLLLYAGLLAAAKDPTLIPRHYAAKMQDPKEYAAQIARVVCITACAPALSGLIGLFSTAAAFVELLIGFVFFIWLGIKTMHRKK